MSDTTIIILCAVMWSSIGLVSMYIIRRKQIQQNESEKELWDVPAFILVGFLSVISGILLLPTAIAALMGKYV